jgi:hypothetical protein
MRSHETDFTRRRGRVNYNRRRGALLEPRASPGGVDAEGVEAPLPATGLDRRRGYAEFGGT